MIMVSDNDGNEDHGDDNDNDSDDDNNYNDNDDDTGDNGNDDGRADELTPQQHLYVNHDSCRQPQDIGR